MLTDEEALEQLREDLLYLHPHYPGYAISIKITPMNRRTWEMDESRAVGVVGHEV